MEENKKSLTGIKLTMIGYALLAIAIGVVFIIKPDFIIKILCYGIGGLLALLGLVRLIKFFVKGLFSSSYNLVTGGIFLIIGIFFILYPNTITDLIRMGIGILIVANGLIILRNSFIAYNLQLKNWYMTLIFGIATVIGGTALLFFANSDKLAMIAGIALIVDGALDIASLVFFIFDTKPVKVTVTEVTEVTDVIESKENNEDKEEVKDETEEKKEEETIETSEEVAKEVKEETESPVEETTTSAEEVKEEKEETSTTEETEETETDKDKE